MGNVTCGVGSDGLSQYKTHGKHQSIRAQRAQRALIGEFLWKKKYKRPHLLEHLRLRRSQTSKRRHVVHYSLPGSCLRPNGPREMKAKRRLAKIFPWSTSFENAGRTRLSACPKLSETFCSVGRKISTTIAGYLDLKSFVVSAIHSGLPKNCLNVG